MIFLLHRFGEIQSVKLQSNASTGTSAVIDFYDVESAFAAHSADIKLKVSQCFLFTFFLIILLPVVGLTKRERSNGIGLTKASHYYF